MSENLNELITYRIQKAYETIAEVEFQIDSLPHSMQKQIKPLHSCDIQRSAI